MNVRCNAGKIVLSANRVGDSFRIVNYAIMLDLGRILSHCTLLHIIGLASVSQHLVPAHIIIPLRMASMLCRFFQLNKNTLKRTGVDGEHIFQISSTVTITRCAHWLVCKVDQSTRVNRTWDSNWELGSSPIFILYLNHLHHQWANWGAWEN